MNTDTYQNSESAAIDSAERAIRPRNAMNFPGDNTLTLTEDAMFEAVKLIMPALVNARIKSMSMTGYRPQKLCIEFTTDPAPAGD